jgi:predicted transcriptional regulator
MAICCISALFIEGPVGTMRQLATLKQRLAQELYDLGLTQAQIARQFRCTQQAISGRLRRHPARRRKNKSRRRERFIPLDAVGELTQSSNRRLT